MCLRVVDTMIGVYMCLCSVPPRSAVSSVYVWGDTWQDAKRHAEVLDYLFEAAIKLKSMRIDPSVPPSSRAQ
jgi:hypothetical protein